MTFMTLQHSCTSLPRRPLLQRFGQHGRVARPLLQQHRAVPRFRTRAASEDGKDHTLPGPSQQLEQLEQQPQQQELSRPRERWQPASLLSGWKGAATMLLSVSAVSGGGLLGSNFDLQGPGSLLQALSVLGATVAIHEFGHFIAARSQGIHVTKFSIGFGPILFKYQGGEVEYSLRALPLGGFVAFPDDEPDSKYDPEDPDLLRNRPVKDRIIVVTAGVIANMLLALALCTTQANTVGVAEAKYFPGVVIGKVNEGAVAQLAGLQTGDVLLDISGMPVAPSPSSVSSVVQTISDNPKRPLTFKVERSGQVVDIPITPAEMPDGTGRIGVSLAANAEITRRVAGSLPEAVVLGAKEVAELTRGVLKGLSQIVTNFSQVSDQVSGPVAILAVGAEVARKDASGLLQFAALVNINLAVVNILPLPALDGGYLVFLVLEAVRGGKKVAADLEKGIMASGLLLLMTAGIFLIVRDTVNLTASLIQ